MAILADAETSRQMAVAAIICANRYTFPSPQQSSIFKYEAACGRLVPPPIVPTSNPENLMEKCTPSPVALTDTWAILLVPTMPKSWPVAAKIAATTEAGVKAKDCIPLA